MAAGGFYFLLDRGLAPVSQPRVRQGYLSHFMCPLFQINAGMCFQMGLTFPAQNFTLCAFLAHKLRH